MDLRKEMTAAISGDSFVEDEGSDVDGWIWLRVDLALSGSSGGSEAYDVKDEEGRLISDGRVGISQRKNEGGCRLAARLVVFFVRALIPCKKVLAKRLVNPNHL